MPLSVPEKTKEKELLHNAPVEPKAHASIMDNEPFSTGIRGSG